MNVQDLIADIDSTLASLKQDYTGLALRDKVLRLVGVLRSTKRLNIAVARDSGCDANSARERIKLYMARHVGVSLAAAELEVVSGISEYGRRIRELRVQEGYRILSCFSNDPEMGVVLEKDHYLLLRAEPDKTAAHRWYLANRIRKKSGSASDRILEYLQANVGDIVTSEELHYVAKVSSFGRRSRELRTEQGFAVATHFTGRPDLKQGEYVLETLERIAEAHDRSIPEEVQRKVYARDANTCRNCRWNRDAWTRDDPRYLELHHIEEHAHGGKNEDDNLLVLCNRCHDDVHAGRIKLQSPT